MRLRVFNLREARFECTFGRGCAGVCCRNGRPPVYPDEAERIGGELARLLPMMRPEAAALVSARGFLSRRPKSDTFSARVAGGWCVFFNHGCVLHTLGAIGGDKFRYKPFACATFPLEEHPTHGWYVRQKGVLGEQWDLPCLDPVTTRAPAAGALAEELALVAFRVSGEPDPSDPSPLSAPVD